MKKVINVVFNVVIPIIVGYAIFGILLSIFRDIPTIGHSVTNLWYVPFSILTLYMGYTSVKDYRLAKTR
ncbi:hypothetical protein [Tissierella sp.]|uniref:hypothetical protein n=1 Tax=Tissierella sp. TaxID=41274 RepID=UPI0028658686|nr:hypothetical protein [Tissierella sp.]MDR7855008.1 hypothetical protein [Tissierella sp.]